MGPHEVPQAVRLLSRLVVTCRAVKHRGTLAVHRHHMSGECLGLEKPLLTDGAGVGRLRLVRLQMIVHRVLPLRSLLAMRTDKVSLSIALIRIPHLIVGGL
jgi:hypothetical protein